MPEHQFERTVEINGLPYIFKGTIPSVRGSSFKWHLVIPEMENYTPSQREKFFDEEGSQNSFEEDYYAVGFMDVDVNRYSPGFFIGRIRSNTPFLSRRLKYHNARGLGNFLLKSLIAEADRRDEPIYLIPDPDPKRAISPEDVIRWYKRNGFRYCPPFKMRYSADYIE